MSLAISSCHGYRALGVPGIPSSTTKLAIVSWIYVPTGQEANSLNRIMCGLNSAVVDGTQDMFALVISGNVAPAAKLRTGNVSWESEPGFYLWSGANQSKWMIAMAVFDLNASGADVYLTYGRAASTAIPATEATKTPDVASLSSSLVNIYVGSLWNQFNNGTGTNSTSAHLQAETAIFVGNIPTQANIDSMIAGASPSDFGAWEHWRFRNSSDGLIGRLRGIQLAPFGGAATEDYNSGINPSVNDPVLPAAPVISVPTTSSATSSSVVGGITTDTGSGTLYGVVTTSATTPTAAQIKNGQNHAGAAAASSASLAVSSAGTKSQSFTGLAASTTYYVHWVHNAVGGDSNTISSTSFTTQAAVDTTPPVVTAPSSQNGATAAVQVIENNMTVGTWTANESVTWSLSGGADVARFSITPGTGVLSFNALPNFEAPNDADTNNTYIVGVRATDASSNVTTQTVTVTVVNANEAPSFAGPSVPTINGSVGVAISAVNFATLFSDPDAGDSGTYSKGGTWPSWANLSAAGVLTGTPTAAATFAGLTVIRTDGSGLTATSNTFSIVASAAAPGVFTSEPLKDNTGALLANVSLDYVSLYDDSTGALIVRKLGLTTNGSGVFVVTDAAVVAGTTYKVDYKTVAGHYRMPAKVAA